MENYEKNISLKTIWLTFRRRYDGILFIFIPILLASFLVTNFMMTKTYLSTATVNNTANVTDVQKQNMQAIVNQNDTLASVADNLRTANIKHANGAWISVEELTPAKSGPFFVVSTSTTSITVTITFQSTDKTITKYVLDEMMNVAIPKFKAKGIGLDNLGSPTPATAGTKNSKETKYFLIAAAAGLVVALAVPFIYEIVADEVFDAKDIAAWGVPASYIDASKGVKMDKKPKEAEAK